MLSPTVVPRLACLLLALTLPTAAHAQGAATDSAGGAVAAAAPRPPAVPARRQSWTADRRAFVVGDVITVTVDEFTLATTNSGNVASDRRRRDASLGIDVRPPGGAGSSVNAGVGTRNDGESTQRGEATRQSRFQGDLSVRVIAVDAATGLLQIKGSKVTNVDKNEQLVTLTGWVRPQDISPQNFVESLRVADAELVYQTKGPLGKPKGGILSRVLGMVWP